MKEKDIFDGDIFKEFAPPSKTTFDLCGGKTKLPQNQDVFFMAKWHELFERYQAARLFLRRSLVNEYREWLNPVADEVGKKYPVLYIRSILYESALMNYNILVDLSWTWTYVSAEYALYKFDEHGNVINAKDVAAFHPIDEAYKLLRDTENGVTTPYAEGNPFDYLKKMRPEYTNAINRIKDFWKRFSESDIRSLYNYTKHKGVLHYSEIDSLNQVKLFEFHFGKEVVPSDISDVQKQVSLETCIQNLIDFDNKELFPYLKGLLDDLKYAVNPSPMLM
jgi:hypothetical protein